MGLAYYEHYGDVIDWTPVADTPAGTVIRLNAANAAIGIVRQFAPANVLSSLAVEGAFLFDRQATEVVTAGQPIYWDFTAVLATITPNGTTVLIGYAETSAVGDGTVTQIGVKLVRSFQSVANAGAGGAGSTVTTLAAAGSTQTDAAPITISDGFVWVTAANAAKGVALPVGVPGQVVEIKNDDAANAVLLVYPFLASGAKINALSANAAISMAAKSSARFRCYSATQWFTLPTVPS